MKDGNARVTIRDDEVIVVGQHAERVDLDAVPSRGDGEKVQEGLLHERPRLQ